MSIFANDKYSFAITCEQLGINGSIVKGPKATKKIHDSSVCWNRFGHFTILTSFVVYYYECSFLSYHSRLLQWIYHLVEHYLLLGMRRA